MIKKLLLSVTALCLFWAIPTSVNAQNEDNIWVFGTNGAIDFNTGTPVTLTGYINSGSEGSASVSDELGNILFYTNAVQVRNRLHAVMPNGAGLLTLGASSSTQGAQICKVPGSDHLYYLFTIDEYLNTPGYLRYHVIDMTLDGGNGDIIATQKNIILDSFVHEKMTLVSDQSCNYWLVTFSDINLEYHAFHITEDGIAPAVISPTTNPNQGVGEIKISPDGTMIANAAYGFSYVELGSFDNATGVVSDLMTIDFPAGSFATSAYGLSFSPGSSKLYVGSNSATFQYDLAGFPVEATIEASAYTFPFNTSYPQFRIASNGKVYFPTPHSANINVINEPDLLGAACDPVASAFTLTSGTAGFGLGSSIITNPNAEIVQGDVYDSMYCYIDSLVLEAPSAHEVYIWDDGSSSPTRTVYSSGTYWVRYGEVCLQTVDTFHITIVDSNIFLYNNDTIVCDGSVIDLVADDVPGRTYEWIPADGIADPTSPTTTFTPTENTTLTLHIRYEGCEDLTRSFSVEVKPGPQVSLPENTTICIGKSYSVEADVPDADEDYSYSWTPTIGVSDPTAKDVVLSPSVSTMYYLTVNSGAEGCEAVDSILITVIPNSIELLNNDTILCAGNTIGINVNGHPSFSYYWTPEDDIANPLIPNTAITPTASGYVTIRASRDGCDDMADSFYVDLQPVPNVNVGLDDTICGGVPYQLFASIEPEDYPDYTYSWSPGRFLSDSTIKDPTFLSYLTSEDLILTVTTPHGCMGRDTIKLNVVPKREVITNTTDTGYCPPGEVQLIASNAETFVWSPNIGLSNDSIANPIASPEHSVEYMVVGNTQGCLDTQYVTVHVYPSAVITLPDSVTIFPGESYEIDLDGNTLYHSWFPPEGLSNVNIANPIASPNVRTRYFVTASTENGCTVVDSIDILMDLGYVFDVPNAFTPGNDFSGNSAFKILKRGDVTLEQMVIFNRWGELVFQTSDINEAWDGTFKGTPQPLGVYVYQIVGVLADGQRVTLNGNVTLIR